MRHEWALGESWPKWMRAPGLIEQRRGSSATLRFAQNDEVWVGEKQMTKYGRASSRFQLRLRNRCLLIEVGLTNRGEKRLLEEIALP